MSILKLDKGVTEPDDSLANKSTEISEKSKVHELIAFEVLGRNP